MTLLEWLRIYDYNITMKDLITWVSLILLGYGFLVGIYTWLISTAESIKTRKKFIAQELKTFHNGKLLLAREEKAKVIKENKSLKKEIQELQEWKKQIQNRVSE